jgi:hypothetical protein
MVFIEKFTLQETFISIERVLPVSILIKDLKMVASNYRGLVQSRAADV